MLERLLSVDNAPHTYIFTGPEFVGKKTLAISYISALMTGSKSLNSPPHIVTHPDIYFVSNPKDITAGTSRAIRNFLFYSPLAGNRKGVIIDNAQMLGSVGSNILLKSLEEPPHQTYTVLVTERPDLLPKTITSRAITIRFNCSSKEELLRLVPATKKQVVEGHLDWIAGRPGLLLEFLRNPNGSQVATRLKYFHKRINGNTGSILKVADDVSKEDEPHIALEGIFLNLWAKSGSDKRIAINKFNAIIKAKEQIVQTNVNVRLCVERALLS